MFNDTPIFDEVVQWFFCETQNGDNPLTIEELYKSAELES